jgi:hypothetical protein
MLVAVFVDGTDVAVQSLQAVEVGPLYTYVVDVDQGVGEGVSVGVPVSVGVSVKVKVNPVGDGPGVPEGTRVL